MVTPITLEHDGQTVTLDATRLPDGRWQVRVNDRSFTVDADALPGGGWRIHHQDGTRTTAYAAQDGDVFHVAADGHVWALARSTPGSPAPAARRATSGEVRAQMPGQVTAVNVTVGQQVSRGTPLVTVEAMKMAVRALAPHDGVVRALDVAVGSTVAREQRLALVAPHDDDNATTDDAAPEAPNP